MEHSLLSRAAEYLNQQRQKKRWQKGVTALAAVVVFCTTYALILPAITMEAPVFCGQEEHVHEVDCREQVLICDLPQGEGHVHADVCWQSQETLVCGREESDGHTHGPDCQQAETLLTCVVTEEGHVHGDGCCTTETTLVCGQEETSGHAHTDACREITQVLVCTQPEEGHVHGADCSVQGDLTCGCEEHTHTDACYSDPQADLESAACWERTFAQVTLTGDSPTDLLAIAETQLGYTESSRNYIINDQGRKQGYSRYGGWYGDPYGDWCAMFVSFCLHYANIPPQDFPREASCQRWIQELTRRDLYRTAGTCQPQVGDLIFFNWDQEPDSDHVGLVKEVILNEMGEPVQIETIEGNCSNQVKTRTYALEDSSILGFGELPEGPDTEEEPAASEEPTEPEEPREPEVQEEETVDNGFISWESLLEQVKEADVSEGPVVYIFARPKEDAPATFSLRDMRTRSVMMLAAQTTDTADETELKAYLDQNGGTYSILLTDMDDNLLPKDENGTYSVTAETTYKLSLTISSPGGIKPGTYWYQLPEGLTINVGTGILLIEQVEVGTWTVDANGRITFVFNEEMNDRTGVVINATMGAVFHQTEEEIPFDGNIKVDVQPRPADMKPTKLQKWGVQGSETETQKSDPGKIYWQIEIIGQEDSHIPGSTITDTLGMGNHAYESDDLAAGLTFSAGQYDLVTGAQIGWHEWHVSFDEVTWINDRTWSYKIPETVKCRWCPDPVTLGNDGWCYYVQYTTTPDTTGEEGIVGYENIVTIDGQRYPAWAYVNAGHTTAQVVKEGVFQGGTDGGKFVWNIDVTIPGQQEGEKADYCWYLWDSMEIKKGDEKIAVRNDLDGAAVTATREDKQIQVPKLEKATGQDEFAWYVSHSEHAVNGAYSNREIMILHRCNCKESNCPNWNAENNTCTDNWHQSNSGVSYCRCWTVDGPTTFNFRYETEDPDIISQYGGNGYVLQNGVTLQNQIRGDDGNWKGNAVSSMYVPVEIPGVFKKELLPREENSYIANYTITVNEAKLTLTDDGSPLTIVDTMTETLAYISGSLVITTEDADGNERALTQGEDYTVTYDGSGDQKDAAGKPVHVMTIEIIHPESVMYTLDYDALLVPSSTGGAVVFSNSATVTLWGEKLKVEIGDKVASDVNIFGKAYMVSVKKMDESTGKALPGATFGLFSAGGGLITSGVTDANGKLSFKTDLTQGICLMDHIPYYVQEITAPDGYITDGTKHWFCFCETAEENCKLCGKIGSYVDRVSTEHTYTLTNRLGTYELPETGGVDPHWYILGGILLSLGGTLWYRKEHMGKEGETS